LQAVQRPAQVIRPESGWEFVNFREIWRFRDLLRTLVTRDIKLRYRQTSLGVIWDLIQTLIPVVIFSLIFGGVAKLPGVDGPYVLFTYCGILGWNAFSNTLNKTSGSVVQDSALLLKVYFPRLILPLATIGATFVDFGIALSVFPILLIYFGYHPSLAILLMPAWLLLTFALALSIGLYLAAIMVTYRDIKYILPVFLQFGFYATPIAYPIPALPVSVRPYFHLNPLANLIEGMRWSMIGSHPPQWGFVLYSIVFTAFMAAFGFATFNRMARRFADVI
jgi:lipopolysaccharide transport system permease protein